MLSCPLSEQNRSDSARMKYHLAMHIHTSCKSAISTNVEQVLLQVCERHVSAHSLANGSRQGGC